jgi:hypothetical protein
MAWAEVGGGRDREVAVDEGRHDLDYVHAAVCLALEDGADSVTEVQVAVVGILELLDDKGCGLGGGEVVCLVALLNATPDELKGVVWLHGKRKLALLEGSQSGGSVRAMGILFSKREDLDRQTHAHVGCGHLWAGDAAEITCEGRSIARWAGADGAVGLWSRKFPQSGALAVSVPANPSSPPPTRLVTAANGLNDECRYSACYFDI